MGLLMKTNICMIDHSFVNIYDQAFSGFCTKLRITSMQIIAEWGYKSFDPNARLEKVKSHQCMYDPPVVE